MLDRASQFLSLTALVSVLLASVMMASARRYSAPPRQRRGAALSRRQSGDCDELIHVGDAVAGAAGEPHRLRGGYAAQAGLAYLLSGLVATPAGADLVAGGGRTITVW